MKGSEKQIRWAEDIKARFAKRIRECYAADDASAAVIDKALDFIDKKYDDASYWIDMDLNRKYDADKYAEVFCEMTADSEMQVLFA